MQRRTTRPTLSPTMLRELRVLRDVQTQQVARLTVLYHQAHGAERQAVEQVRRCVIGAMRITDHVLDTTDET